jgi:hypothetical protein
MTSLITFFLSCSEQEHSSLKITLCFNFLNFFGDLTLMDLPIGEIRGSF